MSAQALPRRSAPLGSHAARTGRCAARRAGLLSLAAALAFAAGCGITAPRAPTLPAWDDVAHAPAAAEADETALWEKARKDLESFLDSRAHFKDAALETYLADRVARLAPPMAEGGPVLRVLVLADVERNAFALPDGTIVVALPLLVAFENEAQLAFVLAHEIVHVARRHSLLSARYDALTASHVERMRMSRRTEAEADRGAIRLMLAAGYDPGEAIPALRHIHAASPGEDDRVRAWSSHEDLPFRLAALRPEIALHRPEKSENHAERLLQALDGVRLQAAVLDLEAGRLDSALAIVNQQLARLPRSGPAHTLRARIRRERSPEARFSKAVRDDLERGVEYAPDDPDALRALGLFLRDVGELERSKPLLRRYLAARPDAFDRKIVERYVAEPKP
jgi:Zn-dependent protease with chaperone function